MTCLLPYQSPLIPRLKLINGPIASPIARLCHFHMVPAVPPGVALIALTMTLAPERQGMKNNHIARVKRTSLAEWGKVGAVNTFCALLY